MTTLAKTVIDCFELDRGCPLTIRKALNAASVWSQTFRTGGGFITLWELVDGSMLAYSTVIGWRVRVQYESPEPMKPNLTRAPHTDW